MDYKILSRQSRSDGSSNIGNVAGGLGSSPGAGGDSFNVNPGYSINKGKDLYVKMPANVFSATKYTFNIALQRIHV